MTPDLSLIFEFGANLLTRYKKIAERLPEKIYIFSEILSKDF